VHVTIGRRLAGAHGFFGRATPWLLLAPALLLLGVFVLLPYVGALLYSLTDAKLTNITEPSFVGLDNFRGLVAAKDRPFGLVIGATVVFTLGTVLGSVGLGTALALTLHSMSPSRRGVLLSLFLVPWVIAGVVVGYTWKLVYDPQVGLANALLATVGIGRVTWLLDRWLAIGSLIVANVWAAYGVVLLVISSALANMPNNIVLAGQIDGAGLWTIVRRIVIPNIQRAFLLATLVAVISGLNVFDLIFVMTGGGPVYQTETLALTMYRLTFRRGDVGEGAAATAILFAFSLALAIAYVLRWQKEAKKWS
jgi:ABC-type sugar transport system permease subunit